jgi:DNA ligase-1
MTADARLPAGPHQLVPLARLHLDLPSRSTAAETTTDGLLEWIQEATMQRFGPVRLLRPDRICEVVFDDLEPSARRKSGLRLTAVRLQRWRSDCSLMDVDDAQRLRGLLAPEINT